ncbi:hypothetical protein, partial [Accumulibacter sp.]|uniref:hypothetical protein n=1 Tax=Accumulibacter sp. TaxID=2053492 RepID=UPI002D0CA617
RPRRHRRQAVLAIFPSSRCSTISVHDQRPMIHPVCARVGFRRLAAAKRAIGGLGVGKREV